LGLRSSGGVNENPGRHQIVTGPDSPSADNSDSRGKLAMPAVICLNLRELSAFFAEFVFEGNGSEIAQLGKNDFICHNA
ncbi:hypothetical protein R5H30_21685, partial [Sulfitobacter sp. D35]|uniref:hypothetical protein n=1 Tax=Sulfitobacter sp. D35 TaxID=3083252 RepID=UPI00296FAB03